MYFGADYYPEHWPRERWERDADLMREAGMNVVRMGEFAWVRIEPEEGRFEFDWLDEALEVLGERGIEAVLGTPTATPPAWLVSEYPEILPVDENGERKGFGSRCHFCKNSPSYRKHTERIVTAMARHYRDHPQVIGWQIDNEFGCHGTIRCHCPECRRAFQGWLRERYGNLEDLNRAWGTVFWSQEYTAWEQIPTPQRTVASYWSTGMPAHSPSLILDFYRFSSDTTRDYQRLQVRILREQRPDWFITHNYMGLFDEVDYYDLAEDLDFISWDNYPSLAGEDRTRVTAMSHDLMRGMKGKGFWVMEQQSGPGGWEVVPRTPPPGNLRLWTYQSIAHGAEGIVYFRWRSCRFGAEQYWHGVLNHDGVPRRRYEEVQRTGSELARIGGELEKTEYRAQVGLLWSYENSWSLGIHPASPGLEYGRVIGAYHRAFHDRHVPVRFLSPGSDLSGCRIIVAPLLHILRGEWVEGLRDFVAGGGTLITTFRSGVREPNNQICSDPLPGQLSDLTGVTVIDYTSLGEGEWQRMRLDPRFLRKAEGRCSLWCDLPEPGEGIQVLAEYGEGWYAGRPAVTRRRYGSGTVYYLATQPDAATLDTLAVLWCQESGVEPLLPAPQEGIRAAKRSGAEHDFFFFLNFQDRPQKVSLPRPGEDIISRQRVASDMIIPGRELAIVRCARG